MKDFLWKLLAYIVSRPTVAAYLIKRAQRTPYYDLEGYMERWWLFNPYRKDANGGATDPRWPKLPSIRIHHILREDLDRALHDHPWNARTIILKGWYIEQKRWGRVYERVPGATAPLKYGEFHTIEQVSPGGVYTMFFTWKYKGVWGFLVNGKKVPWKDYLRSKTNAA